MGTPKGAFPCCKLTMRSSGPRGEAIVFPDVVSARGRLTRRYVVGESSVNDLANAVSVLGKPYTITRSRLGAVTKVFDEKYICDIPALKEIFNSIGEN